MVLSNKNHVEAMKFIASTMLIIIFQEMPCFKVSRVNCSYDVAYSPAEGICQEELIGGESTSHSQPLSSVSV